MNEKFSSWHLLLTLYLKRDWKKIVVWVLGLGLFSAGFVPAFKEIAKGDGLIGMFETLSNPGMVAMVGPTPIDKATEYTLGAMYTHEMLLFSSLFALIISLLHVISHTRKEEDLGLTELVRSFQVGRHANALAAMIEIVMINIMLALFIAGLMIGFNVETITVEGALLFGISVGMAGLMGASIGLFIAQIMPSSSAATGASLSIVGLLYILRAGTDISNVDLSILNPLGWTYLTYPFTTNNWLPLIFALIFVMILTVFAFYLEENRDMGAGYLPQREGRAHAKVSLMSVPGLLWHINKGVIIAWLIAFLLMGAAYGSIYGEMQSFLESNELMAEMFSQAGMSIEVSFTSTIMMVMIVLVSILPIVVINKLFTEEKQLRLSQIYATKVRRWHLYWVTIGIAIFVSLLGVLLAAGGLGGVAVLAMDSSEAMQLSDFLSAGYNLLPTVLFFLGLAACLLGWAPKWGRIVYLYLIYSFMLSYFEGLLDLPDWVFKTAIQSWLPEMPAESFDLMVFSVITVISLVLMVIGFLGYQKRDLIEEA